MNDSEPLQTIKNATVRYYEGEPGERYEVKHEGRAEIFPGWVRLSGGVTNSWIPRERVESVSRL